QAGEAARPRFGVMAGDELAFGLVVYEDAACRFRGRRDRSPVDRDFVVRKGALAQARDAAADRYAAGFNPGFDFPPRAEAGRGEQLLKAFSLRCRWRRGLRLRPQVRSSRGARPPRRTGLARARA